MFEKTKEEIEEILEDILPPSIPPERVTEWCEKNAGDSYYIPPDKDGNLDQVSLMFDGKVWWISVI